MNWDDYWQIFNRLFNAKMWKELNIHLRSNWNPFWIRPRMNGKLDK